MFEEASRGDEGDEMVALRTSIHALEFLRTRAPFLTLVREDSLPEDMPFTDTGCEFSASCFRCPLARCNYDDPEAARRYASRGRDRDLVVLRRKYRVPIDAIAAWYGLSRRQVYRILEREASAGR
jgi:hypothetical protein